MSKEKSTEKSLAGLRLDKALKQAGLSRKDFIDLLNSSPKFRSVVSQNVNNWLNRGVPGGKLIDVEEVSGINSKWLGKGEEPMFIDSEKVTEFLQTNNLKSANLIKGKTMSDQNTPEDQLKKELGKFAEKLQTFRVAPVVGKIVKTEGKHMLLEVNLGGIGVYSQNPEVKCYEDTTGDYSPRIKPREVIIVDSGERPESLDEVLIITKENEVMIKEFVSAAGGVYHLDDINHKEPRVIVEEDAINSIWPITDIYHKARKLPRPIIPETPPGYRMSTDNHETEES